VSECEGWNFLKFASEDFDERQNFAEKFIPAGDLAEAGFFEMGGGGSWVDAGFEGTEAAGAVFEMGIYAVAEVAAGELAQTGLGSEVLFANPRNVNLVDSTEGTKPAQTLAGRSPTQLQTRLHIVERKGLWGAEKEAVNFSDGARERESTEDVNEECDRLDLEGAECGWSRAQGRFLRGWPTI